MAYSALLDANVLHPINLCDLLLRFAERGFYRPLWSRDILNETTQSVARQHPGVSPESLERRVRFMEDAFPDAMVSGYEGLTPGLTVFGTDSHVIAAAIVGHADVVVTQNVRDFPAEALAAYRLLAQTPDDFLIHQWWLDPGSAAQVLIGQSAATRRPHRSPEEILDHLGKSVPAFAAIVRSSNEFARLLGDGW